MSLNKKNIVWVFFDKLSFAAVTSISLAVIARIMGPDDFGYYSYFIALVGLFAIGGHMGLNGLAVKEFVGSSYTSGEIISTIFLLKFLGYFVSILLLFVYLLAAGGASDKDFMFLLVASLSLLPRAFEVIDYWFQSIVKSKYVALSNFSGVLILSALKIVFAISGGGVLWLLALHSVQYFMISVVLIVFFCLHAPIRQMKFRYSSLLALELIKKGWMIFLGSIFAIIYLKIDQIMIGEIISKNLVGIYASSAMIASVWHVIPVAIIGTYFPKLIRLKGEGHDDYRKYMDVLLAAMFYMSVIISLFVSMFSTDIILIVFGESYLAAAEVLVIHSWSLVFVFLRAVFSRWIIIEDLYLYSVVTQGAGAVLNVILNYLLIPEFGLPGAAYSTVVSYAFSSYISLLLFVKTRRFAVDMTLAPFKVFNYNMLRSVK